VTPLAGRLLALEESGHPYVIDPETLDTGEMLNFDGALRPWVPFSAHPHHDARTGETYNFGIDFARARPALRTYRMDSAGRVTSLARAPLPFASFVHDFALSKRFMIFHVPPLVASVARFLFGLDSFFDTLRWRPDRGARWILVPRTGGAAIEIEAPPMLVGHFIGAFEQDDEIVVDFGRLGAWDGIGRSAAAYATSDWPDFGGMKVERHRIDVRTRRASSELLCDLPADFPRMHPDHEARRGGHCFMGCNRQAGEGGLFHAVMKLHRETGAVDLFDFGPDRTSLEPVFVPRPGSDGDDDGWLICLVYDAPSRRSHYAVLDARQVSDGPLATLSLPVSAGATFHGSWLQA
jgi:all-trans-8'-apo-beta-carotenal 15,15'-oxygenase